MKRVNTRGIEQTNKYVLRAALTSKHKEYLKGIGRKPKRKAQEAT